MISRETGEVATLIGKVASHHFERSLAKLKKLERFFIDIHHIGEIATLTVM
jgi:hypothetical protein